ncbi:MAG: hypothetical protein VKJ27_07010 [Synechocystis sp.]|nr:hypothetical protein [Synechocystis sp.]
MKNLTLSPDIENRLLMVSQQLGRPETELIQEAVLSFLEDFEDSQDAQQRLQHPPERYLTLKKVEQGLGLADLI